MMSQLISSLHEPVHASWQSFLNDEVVPLLDGIENQVLVSPDTTTPDVSRVLHFLTNDLNRIQVLILGQDPYPQPHVATGRAFEVGTLNSWHDKYKNVSLKNIIRAIYAAYSNEFLTYNEIRKKMETDLFGSGFSVLPPQLLFKSWEEQGVLLLNTSFTCHLGKPGSHARLWEPFTRLLLQYINSVNAEITWLLWGNHARHISSHISLRNAYTSNHPMICKPGDNDFLFGQTNAFKETRHLVDWRGR
jgi:uracil-DNA glycosylase